jgi:hypothetical protein
MRRDETACGREPALESGHDDDDDDLDILDRWSLARRGSNQGVVERGP